MSVKPLLTFGLMTVTALSLSDCSSEPSGPVPTTLDVNFSTAADDDGAVLFTISGGPVDSVDAAGYRVYLARVDSNTLRVIVAGQIGSGIVARIHIPDDTRLPQYSATLNQVAARASYVQRDPATYSLGLTP
jgi:hypothetical protein